MDAHFWHQRWETNTIAFHQNNANPLLVTYFKELSMAQGSRVFVPLCGKTLDIAWLLAQGCQVTGVELSELAVKQLFGELGTEPEITDIGAVKHYHATDIDIFVGDIFDLTRTLLGSIDAVFDRAALVALPEHMRIRYTKHITDITGNAPQLLITYEYDQRLMEGPPFSISNEELHRHYQDSYVIASLTSVDVTGGLKGIRDVQEQVWLLKPLTTQQG
ncbi:MAG: thiopurine S-methyltransferase [Chloroflexi bacterium AL-N10]|nr:thiopurine S-methyltransferase [Chloroflexi bacterium AL-N1]NOK66696.1 thiopurine S-methyltransferase [Chloroflexi bacterium AL-N10]NOK72084.1 thiopurine S-methyltransferase [Chloroflexi bacterium AL-N5]